jgi:large subunit ribosomal protein L30
MAKKKAETKKLKVTLVRSPIGNPEPQKRTVKALGLRRMHQTIIHNDTPALRGMLDKVRHLVEVIEQD